MVTLPLLLALLLPQDAPGVQDAPTEDQYYALHTVAVPDGIVLEVGGLLPLADDALLVCTRRGEVWRIESAASDAPRFSLWADGLQEPLGLLAHEGSVLTVQRGEVTALRDEDGDGQADAYDVVCDDWDLSGSYHEYAFGPRRDRDGNLWITLNIPFDAQPFGTVDWRGWALRVTPQGELQPVAGGLRSPAGVEVSPWGDVFYTDNQGEWNGASKLAQLTEGSFHGHPLGIDSAHRPESPVVHPGELPDGVLMPTAVKRVPGFTLPAVWFPYDVTGRSPSGMAWDETGGAFGPFDGQLFVGDQYGANVLRVFLEQVDGAWQGACFRFREGLQSGVIRVAFDARGGLWAGMSDRGWSSLGPDPWGLQRLTWTGAVPFEIQRMQVTEVGFRLTFTAPVDERSALDPDTWALRRFTYELHSDYGSDEMDDWELDLADVSVSADGTLIELSVDSLREGYVHELIAEGLRDTEGRPLLHPEAWYTLLARPGGERPPRIALVVDDHTDAASLLPTLTSVGEVVVVTTDHLDALRDADLALCAWTQDLPEACVETLERYVDSGRPLIALGPSLAAFPDHEALGLAEAPGTERVAHTLGIAAPREITDEFADEVEGEDPDGERERFDPARHPVLRAVDDSDLSARLPSVVLDDEVCRVLLASRDGSAPAAWIRHGPGARVLVIALGARAQREQPAAQRLLRNAILWALDLEQQLDPPEPASTSP